MVGELNILSAGQKSQLFAAQKTTQALSQAQLNLSSGRRVNSPLDNPQSFFASFSLSSDAADLTRALDKISLSVNTIQNAESARNNLDNILQTAISTTQSGKEQLLSNQEDLGNVILADNPVVYYRLDETSGGVAENLGSGGAGLNGNYNGVQLDQGALTFSLGSTSARFDGVNDRIDIANNVLINTDPAGYSERTVELTFQADNFGGKQVLFEEGGTGNSAAIYLDGDRVYFAARDAGDFGPFDISAEIEEGKTYQAAFVLDSNAGTFTGYLNGEIVGEGAINRPLTRHGGAVAIGRNAGGTFFHDGANGGNGEYFEGRIADFALYNDVLSQEDLQKRFDVTQLEQAEFIQNEVTSVLSQLDGLAEDSGFRGVNLLNNDNLRTNFTLNGSSNLITEGRDLSRSGLGIEDPVFNQLTDFDTALDGFLDAESIIQNFGNGLASDLSIIESRQRFTENTINNFETGSDDLTLADTDEEAANILSLQARQQVQTATLSLSAQGSNIADLLLRNPL